MRTTIVYIAVTLLLPFLLLAWLIDNALGRDDEDVYPEYEYGW